MSRRCPPSIYRLRAVISSSCCGRRRRPTPRHRLRCADGLTGASAPSTGAGVHGPAAANGHSRGSHRWGSCRAQPCLPVWHRMLLRAALDLDSKPRAHLIRGTPDGFDLVIRPHRRSRRRGRRPGDPGAWRQPIRTPQDRRSRRRRRRRSQLWRGDGDGRRNRPA
jgi:hypothetical protein